MMNEYQKYKETSLEYVGAVPSEWNLVPLKFICSVSKGKKPVQDYQDYEEGMLPYLSMEFLRNQNANNNTVYVKNDDSTVVFVDDNDLLILWDGSKAGEVVKAKKGALSSTMAKLELIGNTFNIDYLTYYLKSCESFIQDNTIGMGIPHVNGNILRTLLIAQPNPIEQSQIVQFLDYQTSLIDEIISSKEKQIDLLKEKRQAIINELVTKGLDTNALMKDSGLEWLGEIPEHWNTIKLKYLIDALESGVSVNSEGSPIDFESDEIGVLKTSCVFGYCFNPDENKKVVDEEISRVKCPVRANSIIISRMNTPELVGASGFVDKDYENLFLPDRLWQTVFKEDIKFDVEFISYVLISETYKELYGTLATGTSPSMKNISQSSFLDIPIPELPFEEQVSIKDTIKSKKKEIERLIELQIESVNKLKEYRQSIISEAVTGKIDVRDWQPNNNLN